jgi:hypothetical protein
MLPLIHYDYSEKNSQEQFPKIITPVVTNLVPKEQFLSFNNVFFLLAQTI